MSKLLPEAMTFLRLVRHICGTVGQTMRDSNGLLVCFPCPEDSRSTSQRDPLAICNLRITESAPLVAIFKGWFTFVS